MLSTSFSTSPLSQFQILDLERPLLHILIVLPTVRESSETCLSLLKSLVQLETEMADVSRQVGVDQENALARPNETPSTVSAISMKYSFSPD